MADSREHLVRKALWLNYATLSYNALEAVVALVAGIAAGSVALVGFGVDSVIETTASGTAQWRLRADVDRIRREQVEHLSLRVIGWCFIVLAAYVLYDAANALWNREVPRPSPVGIALTSLSLVVMPVLARAKRRIGHQLNSGALVAEATQTSLCAYLSAIVLVGLALYALFGWWWADPVAALAMVPIIANEGVEGIRGKSDCAECPIVQS